VREVIGPFVLGVGLFTFALVSGRLLKLTEMVVNRGVTLSDVLALIGFIMPGFLELTLPMALLLGVLMGFGRMSGERELTAARACGISLYRLAAPVMVFALVIYALSSWLAFSVRPWANANLSERLFEITRTGSTAALKEKVFNHDLPGLVVYADHISNRDSSLRGVLISDARNRGQQNTIIAKRGLLLPDERNRTITLRLFNGSVFGVDSPNDSKNVTSFRVYDLSIRPEAELGMLRLDPEAMSYGQLKRAIAQGIAAGKPDFDAETEMAGKFTIPLASLLFGLLGVSLGLKPARGGQSERLGVSIGLFFVYYMLMHAGEILAGRGMLNAYLAMGIPDAVFAVLALWLFYRSASDRGDQGRGPGDILWDLVERFERRREAA
jgi:lipopolysaccharide export system permease protein